MNPLAVCVELHCALCFRESRLGRGWIIHGERGRGAVKAFIFTFLPLAVLLRGAVKVMGWARVEGMWLSFGNIDTLCIGKGKCYLYIPLVLVLSHSAYTETETQRPRSIETNCSKSGLNSGRRSSRDLIKCIKVVLTFKWFLCECDKISMNLYYFIQQITLKDPNMQYCCLYQKPDISYFSFVVQIIVKYTLGYVF